VNHQYSGGKRQREADKARKRQDKLEARVAKRDRAPARDEIVSAESMHGNLPSIEEAMRAIESRSTSERSAASIPARLFVGGLSEEVTEHDLRAVFGELAKVADAVVMLDRMTRAPRGFGFVTLEDRKDAARVIDELHGRELKGRSLVVNAATDRPR